MGKGWRKLPICERLEIQRQQGQAIEYAASFPEARQYLEPSEAKILEAGLARHGSAGAFLAWLDRERMKKIQLRRTRRRRYEQSLFRGGNPSPLTPENLGLALHNVNKAAKRPALQMVSDRLYAIKERVLERAIRDGFAVFVAWHRAGKGWVEEEFGARLEDCVYACHRIGEHTFHTLGNLPSGAEVVDLPEDWISPRTKRSVGATLRDSLATLRAYLGEEVWGEGLKAGDSRQANRR